MLVFAYDGSLNGDWVAHYAIRFAANTADRLLRIVHVEVGGEPLLDLPARLARIEGEATHLGVSIEVDRLRGAPSGVADRLHAHVPTGTTVVTGTRARPRRRALLAHTVSARLLYSGILTVIVIRVVHPGILGQPGRVLVPMEGALRPATDPLPVLRLLGHDLQAIHVLWVRQASALELRFASGGRRERWAADGREAVRALEARLRAGLEPQDFELDGSLAISAEPAHDIRVQALRHRTRLICFGAERTTSHIEDVLAVAPADVAIHRCPR